MRVGSPAISSLSLMVTSSLGPVQSGAAGCSAVPSGFSAVLSGDVAGGVGGGRVASGCSGCGGGGV
eukprot:535193-Karenia_brevis.AAC.1